MSVNLITQQNSSAPFFGCVLGSKLAIQGTPGKISTTVNNSGVMVINTVGGFGATPSLAQVMMISGVTASGVVLDGTYSGMNAQYMNAGYVSTPLIQQFGTEPAIGINCPVMLIGDISGTFNGVSITLNNLSGNSISLSDEVYVNSLLMNSSGVVIDSVNGVHVNSNETVSGNLTVSGIAYCGAAVTVSNQLASKAYVDSVVSSALVLQGNWSATGGGGTPDLVNGTGTVGYFYICISGGSANFGAGSVTVNANDWIVYTNTNVWEVVPTAGEFLPISGGTLTGTLNVSGNLNVSGLSTFSSNVTVSANVFMSTGNVNTTPVSATDIANKLYVDNTVSGLNVSGIQAEINTISGQVVVLNTDVATISGQILTLSGSIVNLSGVVASISGNFIHFLNLSGGQISGNLGVSGNVVLNTAQVNDPVNPLDVANKEYVDNTVSGLNVSGIQAEIDTISGQVVVLNTNVATISGQILTLSGSIVSLSGTVASISGNFVHFLNLSGGQISGNLGVSGNVVLNTAQVNDPVNPLDVANKEYVDNTVSGLNVSGIQAEINTISGQVVTLNSNVSTISGQVVTLNTNVSTISGQIVTLNTNVSTISGQILTLSGSIVSLSGTVASISGNFSNFLNLSGGTISGNLNVSGTATISGVLTVTSTGVFNVDINSGGSVNVSNALNVSGGIVAYSGANVSGQWNLYNSVSVAQDLDVSGTTNLYGSLNVSVNTALSGTVNVSGVLTVSGNVVLNTGTIATTPTTSLNIVNKAYVDNSISGISGTWLNVSGGVITGTLNISNSLTVSSTIQSYGTTTVAAVNVSGTSNLYGVVNTGQNLNVSNACNVSGNLTVYGTSNCASIGVSGSATFYSGLTVSGNVTVSGSVQSNGFVLGSYSALATVNVSNACVGPCYVQMANTPSQNFIVGSTTISGILQFSTFFVAAGLSASSDSNMNVYVVS